MFGGRVSVLFWLFPLTKQLHKSEMLNSVHLYAQFFFNLKNKISNVLCFNDLNRWETTQVPGVWQGVQPKLQPHHTQPQTHGLQAFRLWDLLQGLPEESGPPQTPREPARPKVTLSGRRTTANMKARTMRNSIKRGQKIYESLIISSQIASTTSILTEVIICLPWNS